MLKSNWYINISQSCPIPWRAERCTEAALWTLCHVRSKSTIIWALGSSCFIFPCSGEGHRYLAQFVVWLSLHLADIATKSFIHCKVHKFCEHLGEPGLPGVPLCNFLHYVPLGESCCSCPFRVPTFSIPKGHSLPESVKVVSLLLCVNVHFHSSVEFKDTRSFPSPHWWTIGSIPVQG